MQGEGRKWTCRDRLRGAPRLPSAPARLPITAGALLAVGALIAGCGGGSPGDGVAKLGSRSAKAQDAGSSSTGFGKTAGAPPGSQAIRYTECVRAHGVPDFPYPEIHHSADGGMGVSLHITPGISNNPKFKSAQEACRKLQPGGESPGEQRAVSPREQNEYLKAAACIRSHGVPGLPDPTFAGGGVHIDHRGLNETSPVFKAAVKACESLIPGGAREGGSDSAQETAP